MSTLGVTEEELWERGGEAKNLMAYEDRIYIANEKVILHLGKKLLLDPSDNDFDLSEVESKAQADDSFSLEFILKHFSKAIAALEKNRPQSE